MNLLEAKKELREHGYKLYKTEYITESFGESFFEFLDSGLSILFSPFLRILAVLDGPRAEDYLTEDLERIEYQIIKKILNNKFLRLIFNKIIKNKNLKEKVKNKLLEIITNRYGYLDLIDKRNDLVDKMLNNILKKLENNEIDLANSAMNSLVNSSEDYYNDTNNTNEDY